MTRLLSILPAVALCLAGGCSNHETIARCGDFEITVDDLRFEVEHLGPSYDFDGSPESRMRLVENLTARYIIAEEAAALGFEEGADEARMAAEKLAVADAYGEWKVKKGARVPRISSLKWRPKLDRSLHLKDIRFSDRRTAEDAAAAIMAGAGYEDLGAAYAGIEGVVFTDHGYKTWRDMDKFLTKYVFPLEIGQFSTIVNMSEGYHLFYLEDASEAGIEERVIFLRAKRFEGAIKEERLERRTQRELVARYDFELSAAGVNAALEAFSLTASGERPSQELLDTTVATYSGGSVTVMDLFNLYFSMSDMSRFYVGDGYGIIMGALDAAQPDLYALAGYDMNLDRMYEVRWNAERARKDYLIPQMEDHLRSQIDITDAEISQYYEERQEDLVTSKSYRASRILLEDEAAVAEVLAELEAGRDFGALAREYSQDSYTGPKGGDMGMVPYGVIAVYDSVIDCLEPGDISPPFTTTSGVELLMLGEVVGGEQLAFDEAVPYIEMYIRNTRANVMLNDLVGEKRRELGYFVDEDLLTQVWLPEPVTSGITEGLPED